MKRPLILRPLLYSLLLFIYIGCKPEKQATATEWGTAPNSNKNPKGYAQRLEMPRLEHGNLFNCYTTSFKGKETVTFSIEYDPAKRHAKWVAYTIDHNTAQKNWSRGDWEKGDPFSPDPKLPKELRIGHAEHRKDQYDRGHLCASEDRVYSQDANAHTFYYSNISPQLEAFNQRGPWYELEKKVREWGGCEEDTAPIGDTLYIVKGGTIRDGEFYDSRGKHGTIVKRANKMNGIVVPAHFFIALVSQKANSFTGIAFYLDHKDHGKKYRLTDYTISIDSLETLTGIDFFCNFPDKMEEHIELECNPKLWGL